MRSPRPSFREAPDSGKSSLKRLEFLKKPQQLLKKNPSRLRIVQSVRAGHVRGGHGFH